jgi:multiple sugar transport system substrate-binding protein
MTIHSDFGGFSRRDFLRLAALATGGLALGTACQSAPSETEAFQGDIEFWDWAYPPRIALLKRLVKEWESDNPDVTLKYNPLEWTEIETKILTAATSGAGPAFSNMHYFWRYDLQRAGVLAPYPEDMFDWDDLISTPFNRDPETDRIFTSDFCYYCSQIYYNKELLDQDGIKESEIPRKWDDSIAMAQQLTKTDASGKIEQVGMSINDYWSREWLWMDLIYQQGGWLWNDAGTEALWNGDEGVQALQFIQDVYHRWKVDDAKFLAQPDAFGNGKAATYVNLGYTGAAINEEFPKMKGKWATSVEPTLSGEPLPAWGLQVPEEGFTVFNQFPEAVQRQAFDFIEFTLGPDAQRIAWALVMLGPPDAKHLLDHEKIAGNNVIATQAETLPYRINYGERPIEAEKLWRTMFDDVVLKKADPKTVLDDVTAQMNEILKSSGKQRFIVERNYTPPSG